MKSIPSRWSGRLFIIAVAVCLLAGTVGLNTTASAEASVTPRFSAIVLTAAKKKQYGKDMKRIADTVYGEYVVDSSKEKRKRAKSKRTARQVASDLSGTVPLSSSGQAQVATYAESIRELGDNSAVPKLSFTPSAVVDVKVSDQSVAATQDKKTGKVLVESTLKVVTRYDDNGPATEELIDYLAVVNPATGNYESVKALDFQTITSAPGAAAGAGDVSPSGAGSAVTPDFAGKIAPSANKQEHAIVNGTMGAGAIAIIPMGLSASQKKSAAKYALKYSLNRNTSYRHWGGKGGDCTNFVSQALRAGGWKDKRGWYRDTHNWWYTRATQTTSWVNADGFYDFSMIKIRRTKLLSSVWRMNTGDVLQYRLTKGKPVNHTMIVTAKSSGGEIYLSYHSNNTKNKRLSDILRTTKPWRWYAHWV